MPTLQILSSDRRRPYVLESKDVASIVPSFRLDMRIQKLQHFVFFLLSLMQLINKNIHKCSIGSLFLEVKKSTKDEGGKRTTVQSWVTAISYFTVLLPNIS